MAFTDCACHVFAIDGYTDDTAMGKVNTAYANVAAKLVTANNKESRQVALAALLKGARLAGSSAAKAKLYGGFRRGQNAPEHMWIEYENYIYDTMPTYGLCRMAATAASRTNPGLENEDFGSGAVCIDMTLTASQLSLINAGDFIKPVH